MAYGAICVSSDPISYFHQTSDEGPLLRVADVILRENKNPKEVFSGLIRLVTNSKWSHSAILFLISGPKQGFDNTFLVEALTSGVHIASWRRETAPDNDLAIPEHRDAAISNLHNLHRVIFRDDPENVITNYIQQVQSGKLDLAASIPDDVLDLLKTATPADFNNSPNLEWRYIIHNKGRVWQIDEASEDYTPGDEEEAGVLELLSQEHR